MAVLKEISLGGFQVFDQLTRIPIGDLTLLFGPNSAGKSAVADALFLLRQFWTVPEKRRGNELFSRYEGDRSRTLRRDWRRGEGNLYRDSAIRLHAKVQCDAKNFSRILNSIDGLVAPELPSSAKYDLETRLSFEHRDSPKKLPASDFMNIEVLVDGRCLLILSEHSSVAIDLRHPILALTNLVLEECSELARVDANRVTFKDGWVTMHIATEINGFRELDIDLAEDVYLDSWEGTGKPPPIRDALEELASIHDPLLRGVSEIMQRACTLSVVSASRKIPTDEELTYLIGPGGSVANAPDLNLSLKGIPAFVDLAESCARVAWEKNSMPDGLDGDEEGEHIHDLGRSETVYLVNRMLSDHLFAKRGYRVDVDYQVLVNGREFRDMTAGKVSSGGIARQPTMLAHLILADAQGRRFSFTDVGSGLGYVLPVLVAIWSKSRSFIQQPELHLHPALQASLGDVFLEAKNGGHRLIIETHSEHLLLRMLKRIRQGSKDARLGEELKLAANELVVLYFDPSPDGSTKVKHLRVDNDGEFLDRWPNGFFTERDQELFDDE